ncbi:MAG: hypothetical protein ABSA03_03170 [Streptosporangiaceae bacterium]
MRWPASGVQASELAAGLAGGPAGDGLAGGPAGEAAGDGLAPPAAVAQVSTTDSAAGRNVTGPGELTVTGAAAPLTVVTRLPCTGMAVAGAVSAVHAAAADTRRSATVIVSRADAATDAACGGARAAMVAAGIVMAIWLPVAAMGVPVLTLTGKAALSRTMICRWPAGEAQP